jgi:hypothetical protein
MNVIIVKHKPIEDNINPTNVIAERICSTNLGDGFCSISLKNKLFIININLKYLFQTIKTAKCVK